MHWFNQKPQSKNVLLCYKTRIRVNLLIRKVLRKQALKSSQNQGHVV